ncbi:MAG: biofilm formation regulator BssS [Enterobacteriaceae bacterium]
MNNKNDIIQTHPVVGWDISTVNPYDAMMLRVHYLDASELSGGEEVGIDRTLWLTTDVARQLISVLQQGISQIEESQYETCQRH